MRELIIKIEEDGKLDNLLDEIVALIDKHPDVTGYELLGVLEALRMDVHIALLKHGTEE